MRRLVKARLVLLLTAATAALAVAGCGGSGDSSSDPATLAPPKSPLFIEAAVQPEGELKSNIEALAKSIGGIDDLGGRIVSELESSASSSDEELDYATEIEPWLGEKGGLFFQEYDGEDFEGYGVAIQSTDTAATQDFIDHLASESEEPVERGSYDGIDYTVETEDQDQFVGVIGDFLVVAEDKPTFEAMVDANNGESLADVEDYASTVDAAPSGSFADIFVDIGALIDQSGGAIDPEAQQFLDSAGIDPEEATALASLIPGSDQIEIDISTDLGDELEGGDVSQLLGSLPADSLAAVAAPNFGDRFKEAVDQIDADGIPGEIPAGEFKSTLEEAGIDLDKISASIGDLAVFAEGSSESSLAGAVVLTTTGAKEATNTVSNIGLLLRASGTPGVTAISGKASGFSIRSDDLGPKPLVVAAQGERIAIAYGLPAAKRALVTDSGQTLADSPTYGEAVSSLGSTPITGFVDGPAALSLASALIPADEKEGFLDAKPYLSKIDYLAIGGDQTTAKLIAGIGK
jgi:hypothetical protein